MKHFLIELFGGYRQMEEAANKHYSTILCDGGTPSVGYRYVFHSFTESSNAYTAVFMRQVA